MSHTLVEFLAFSKSGTISMYQKKDPNININKRATIYDNGDLDLKNISGTFSKTSARNALWNLGPSALTPDTWCSIPKGRSAGWNCGPVKSKHAVSDLCRNGDLDNGNTDSGYMEYTGPEVIGPPSQRKHGTHKVGPCNVPLLERTENARLQSSKETKCALNVTDYYIKGGCRAEEIERSPSVSSSSTKKSSFGSTRFWDSMGDCCVKRKYPPQEKHKDKPWRLSSPWKQDGYVDMQQKRVSTSSNHSRSQSLHSHRYDSLRKLDPNGHLEDEEQLRQHTWYQAGIPREIALEILLQQEIGSFIVRDSTTHPGCYALSVKVPKFENPAGISHYLIHRTPSGGVKLKGLDKEWPNLMALVVHHTVMPEMLACTLRLPRNSNNPTFNEIERDEKEEDEDYQKLSDFSTMMAELKKV